jgi:hypothetical protein
MAPQAVLQNGAATPELRDRCARLHHGQGQEDRRIQVCGANIRAPGSGLHSDHLRNRLAAGESASVLAAVKMLWGGSEGTYPSLH